MKKEEIERLKYRNQYLLTPSSIECPFLHNKSKVGGRYVLYTHKDLVVTSVEQEDIKLILLGDLYDYKFPEKNNEEILRDLIAYEFESLLEHANPNIDVSSLFQSPDVAPFPIAMVLVYLGIKSRYRRSRYAV